MDPFESIYKNNYPGIYGFLYRMCGSNELSEELTQETFYQAFVSFRRYNGNCSVFTWLAAVAKNVYFKHIRKNAGKILPPDFFFKDAPTEEEECLPEMVTEKNEIVAKVRSAIALLPEKYKDVVVLRTYANLSFAEISGYLKISENSAKVIYFRAKNQLREDLKNEHLL